MPRIFDNIELDLLPALRATLEDLGIRPKRLARGSGETEFIQVHAKGVGNGGKAKSYISICGQAPNYTIGRLTRMNKLVPFPVGSLSP
jgi:hypothetical protein